MRLPIQSQGATLRNEWISIISGEMDWRCVIVGGICSGSADWSKVSTAADRIHRSAKTIRHIYRARCPGHRPMSYANHSVSVFTVREGTGIMVLSRVTDWQNTKVLKAAIESLTYYVYDLETGLGQPELKVTGSLSKDTCWSDSYLTAGWTVDTTGYNAFCPIPASSLTFPLSRVKGGRVKIEIIGTPVTGDQFWVADLIVDCADGLSRGTA